MSVSQAIMQSKPKDGRERGPAWHRSTTRRAILDAARTLIARDGFDKMTLIRVAEEAGFASAAVYAYFVRKADLLSAIVADDLATFAKAIKEGFPFTEPGSAVADESLRGEPASPQVASDDKSVEPCDATPEQGAEVSSEPHDMTLWTDESLDSQRKRTDAQHDIKQEKAGPAETGSGEPVAGEGSDSVSPSIEARLAQLEARRVDSWLERRLREFERMLAALEERVTTTDRNNAAAATPLESRLQELFGRFESFEKNHVAVAGENAKTFAKDLEACESRLREAWSELRTQTLEASGRIDTLERDREMRALATEMSAPDFVPQAAEASGPAQVEKPEQANDVQAVDASDPSEKSDAPETPAIEPEESYLAAARRAAQSAHSLQQTDDRKTRRRSRGSRNTTAYILVGACASIVLVGSIAGVALSGRAERAPLTQSQATMSRLVRASLPAAQPSQTFNSIYSSARSGDGRAQLQVALAYLNGNGVEKNEATASRWLESAASSGDPVAQYWLGTLFEHGRGEVANPASAVRWYEAAALQGNLKAMYKLAVAYAEGWGVQKNYGEASRWFSRAAEMGSMNAQYNLGVLYERGMGVPQSLLDAYKWYALAAAQGDSDSAQRVDALSSQLSAEDLATAREAVGTFKAEPTNEDANTAPAVHVASAPVAAHAQHAAKN